ncbi:MAG TPA: hypothetical protein DD727_01600 [Clostridiales bacterium]|nr:hypothetical protein [Clostridiales bacterium]
MNYTLSIGIATVFCLLLPLADRFWPDKTGVPVKPGVPDKAGSSNKAGSLADPAARKGATNSKLLELLVLLFSAALIFLFNNHRFVIYNNYSYLAQSLLQGRLDVPQIPDYLESVSYNGTTYMHFAPGPSILLLPLIAIFGMGFNIGILANLLGAFNILLFYRILIKLGFDDLKGRLWLTALFGFGTVHFFLSVVGHSWFLGHVSATFFILLALLLTVGKAKRGKDRWCIFLLAGLAYGMAVTCRMPLLLSGLLFLGLILLGKKAGWKGVLLFAAGAAVPGGLYMLYNYLRFDTILDLSYVLTFAKDRPEMTGGPLQLQFVPYNLYSMFILSPEFTQGFPWLKPSLAGVSLTFTSPALFAAVMARGEKWMVGLLWQTAGLTALPFLLNYGNGMAQFGMRYAMDFIPFLMILAAMGWKKMGMYRKGLISLCIWLNIWGVLYWNAYYLA